MQGQSIDGADAGTSPADGGQDEEWDEEYDAEPEVPEIPAEGRRDRSQHLQRDFSYVRSELIRVAAIGTFLVVSLVITSILR